MSFIVRGIPGSHRFTEMKLIREIPPNGFRMRQTMDRKKTDNRDQSLSYPRDANSCADLLRDGLLFKLAVKIATLNQRIFGSSVTECKSSHSLDSDHSLGGYCGL